MERAAHDRSPGGGGRAGRIEGILDEYLAPIDGPVMVSAANAMLGAAAIALAKPHLAARIAARILGVERARYATAECRNVAIGHALRALEKMLPILNDTEAIHAFATRQKRNRRPATRAKAARLAARLSSPASARRK